MSTPSVRYVWRCSECGMEFDTEDHADFHVSEAPRVILIERRERVQVDGGGS